MRDDKEIRPTVYGTIASWHHHATEKVRTRLRRGSRTSIERLLLARERDTCTPMSLGMCMYS
jgi:hypothetical protein